MQHESLDNATAPVLVARNESRAFASIRVVEQKSTGTINSRQEIDARIILRAVTMDDERGATKITRWARFESLLFIILKSSLQTL